MKFGTLLELNSNIEWWDHYVDYESLKKLFPSVPLDPDYLATQQHAEAGSLLPTRRPDASKYATPEQFRAALDHEREKVAKFYEAKFAELQQRYDIVLAEVTALEDAEGYGDAEDDVILEEDEDQDGGGDGDGDGAHEGDNLLPRQHDRASHSPVRPVMRGRTSIFGRLVNPRGFRRGQPSADAADLLEAAYQRPGHTRSLSRTREPMTPSVDDPMSPPLGRGRVPLPRPSRGRRSSDLESSVDDVAALDRSDRRTSVSSQSSGAPTWPRRRHRSLGLALMDPSSVPDWARGVNAANAHAPLTDSVTSLGTASEAGRRPTYVWTANNDFATITRIGFKKRITPLWLDAYALKQYVDLNLTAFEKILKKYDKNTKSTLKKAYLAEEVVTSTPWRAEDRAALDQLLARTLLLYRRVVTSGDEDLAKEQLRAQLREKVVIDRETVWSQMVSGRRGQGIFRSVTPDEHVSAFEPSRRAIRTPCGTLVRPEWLSAKAVIRILALGVLVGIVQAQPFERVEESNCLALLVFCTILWATEAIPLFVTSLSVPFLVVILRVIRSTDGNDARLTASDATKYIFSQMFSPTIMLLIGGFTIAAVLSKTRLDVMTASRVLNAAGSRPSVVLLVLMFVATFASMWISNVAAPTLCYALIKPITDELHPKSVFSKALIIAIALASNIGGQASPISSPQNLIALGAMDPPLSWLEWFAISLPVAGMSVVVIWAFLHLGYRWEGDLRIPRMRKNTDTLTLTHYYVLGVSAATIALWCAEKSMEGVVGDMGIIAIIPLVAFFGAGILSKEDFHSFHWSIVFLAMGGIALGKAVLSSGLLDDLDLVLERAVDGLGLYAILAVFSALALVIATFISHTIAAVLLVPIATRIGQSLDDPHPRLLIMVTALICSAGMGLPVSGFPNMTAITQENKLGQRFIGASDFLKNGVPASVLATFIIGTIGYAIMRAIGL
ncbi:low-affinity phosphate transporter [Cryptotrichosporon argae]